MKIPIKLMDFLFFSKKFRFKKKFELAEIRNYWFDLVRFTLAMNYRVKWYQSEHKY